MSKYSPIIIGSRFGKLTVIADEGIVKHKQTWRVLCDCKRETTVAAIRLKVGKTTSCGCRRISDTKMIPIPNSEMPDTILIPLSVGRYALIDQEDYEKVSQKIWYYKQSRNTGYAVWRGCVGDRIITIWMHRYILGLTDSESTEIDHKNLNGLDNRKDNLRVASPMQNRGNTNKRRDNKWSGYKGVTRNSLRGKTTGWIAQITRRGKHVYLGSFRTPEQAARTYDEAAKEYFGEFARCNFLT